MDSRKSIDGLAYDMSAFSSHQPPIFGSYNADDSPIPTMLSQGQYYEDLDGLAENDPKRRRIARVGHTHRKTRKYI
jgi:hypothetical protein